MNIVMMTDEMLEHYADVFLEKGIYEFTGMSFLKWMEIDVLQRLGRISIAIK